MDKLSHDQRKKNMQAIKCKGSEIENILAKGLWNNGLRYRRNDKSVFGKPDFVFKKHKIAVFVDSEFWHGKNWEEKKFDFKTKQEFWLPKIERNIQRDIEVNKKLFEDGWTVFRFWGKEIKTNSEDCITLIINMINENRRKN